MCIRDRSIGCINSGNVPLILNAHIEKELLRNLFEIYRPTHVCVPVSYTHLASSGIGKLIALRCSEAGSFTIITGRNEERLNDVYQKLNSEKKMCIRDSLYNIRLDCKTIANN